jgi:hypothetical protein
MDSADQREALKVTDVDRQQLCDAMNVHARRDPGIMDLHASDFLVQEQVPPVIMDGAAVRQKLKIAFDYTGEAIRLVNAQAEAIPVERAGGSIPKLTQNL